MDKAKAISLVEKYSEIVKNYFSVKKILLFGSYCKDEGSDFSDIDVAVVVDRIEGDFLTAVSLLYKLRENIDFKIEPILFALEEDDKGGFLDHVLETGIVIYQTN
ncbi:MAG: nucleotidyltransferase domain-containing protein [Bacteroidetes bacterium]|nr:nucleotidyltransferase domain-containing protein [Bacteroidota bacterium]